MPINVICPGCHARFTVSDKFAGRSGACPKCKAAIQVPAADQQVEVHAPEAFSSGGRGVDGKLTLKPIAREQSKFAPGLILGILGAVAVVFLVAWLAGGLLQEYWIIRALALVLVSPPLAVGGYYLLRNEENLDVYTGMPLLVRTAICAAAYAALWGVFGYASGYVLTGPLWNWAILAPPFIITGALVALGCYDFDFGTGALHYSFFLLVTILLRGCAGIGWIWQIGQ